VDHQNVGQPKPFIMWIIALFAVTMAVVMYTSSDTEGWTGQNIISQMAISSLAFGLLVTALAPQRGWWGIRLAAFVIFASYFWYIIDQFLIQGSAVDLTVERSTKSPFNALLGLLIFGIPCLMFSLWGDIKGKIAPNTEQTTEAKPISHKVAIISQWLFLALSAAAALLIAWQWL